MRRIALLQARSFDLPGDNQAKVEGMIREAAAGGAQIICTQELCLTPYFCRVQDPGNFRLAVSVPGKESEGFARLAGELEVVLIVSLFEHIAPGLAANTALVFDADGTMAGKYRKMHIPQDPGFEEKFYFTPGDSGFKAWETRYGKIGVLICWDQWFPEAARLTALQGAGIIFYPTAIGWLPEDEARVAAAQHYAWRTVQQGHAVANGCYVAAANRVGAEGDTTFWGRSFVADYMGQVVGEASDAEEEILYADCDFDAMEEHRRMWPFFRDKRIDSYSDICRRWTE